MVTISSDIFRINSSQEKLFAFLSNISNFKQLMPEQVINWKAENNHCSFTIKGMADLSMRTAETIQHHTIVMVSDIPSPFEFKLFSNINNISENQVELVFRFEAELSPMFAMLARNPLTNLLNTFGKKASELSLE